MDITPNSSNGEIPLPVGFSTIEQIRNIPNDSLRMKPKVNVIGFIKDFQAPMRTRGTDVKCTFTIIDHSNHEMKVDFFEKAVEDMPPRPNLGDLVLIRNIKAQWYQSAVSLLKHHVTECHFLALSSIPKKAKSGGLNSSWRPYPPGKGRCPTSAEMSYVLWAIDHVEEIALPSDHEYHERLVQANKPNKDKFSLLRHVDPNHFYDILGEIIKLHDSLQCMTVYLTDYTANKNFFEYSKGSDGIDGQGQEGDEYGYLKPKRKEDWPGPDGKLTIQLTLFDEHAQFVRERVKENTWVLMKNVQIKYGKTGGVLEGYMRGDGGKMNVTIVKVPGGAKDLQRSNEEEDLRCKENDDPRFKEAVQRKMDWKKKSEKKQLGKLVESAGPKRKRDDEGPAKSNSKKRREEKRAAGLKKIAAEETKTKQRLNLNDNIRCNHPDQPIVSLAEILKPRTLTKNEEGQQTPSSFTCARYRANVKVVDFFPHKIEDFAVGHRASEFDILSDYSGGEETDREEEMRIFKSGKGFAKNTWEWRFALQVEDAYQMGSKSRLWLIVNNHAAQGLLGLEDDATNLRANPKLLSQVKEQLFKLWGDLEERKSEMLRQQSTKEDIPASSLESEFSVSTRRAGEMPDADSDVEHESPATSKKTSHSSILPERDPNISISGIVDEKPKNLEYKLEAKNKAFTCCIQQYGVKVHEDDAAKANAGIGKRWQRVFGLFGTQIV